MCPVYLVLMDLFTALNAPPLPSPIPTPPVSEEYGGRLHCVHFLLPWPFILIRE